MTNSRPLRANGLLVSSREPDKVSSGWLRITPVCSAFPDQAGHHRQPSNLFPLLHGSSRPSKDISSAYSDACTEATYAGLGGFSHGAYWSIVLSPEQLALEAPISGLEFIALDISGSCLVRLLLRTRWFYCS